MSRSVHVHVLRGCSPEPLAGYLKALAVLRLVATQCDAMARGWWREDGFFLATTLDEDELVHFFLHEYSPTPLVTPWNGGSGFYPKDTKAGIDAIASGGAARFKPYREAIATARELVGDRTESPKKEDKEELIRACRNTWRGPSQEWLDAALVITSTSGTNTNAVRYPALLGTGGNDGRLDFANNQMQNLVDLLSPDTGEPRAHAEAIARVALFGGHAAGLQSKAVGQFSPGAAGGANASSGFDGSSQVNLWEYVLMLEGAVMLRVAAVRRLGSDDLAQASAPFAVRSQAGGYASASEADESARGEQWMPLWRAPATLAEVKALFAEGRLQSGRQRARRALDAARAVARLGAARGVDSFVRFGFIERNGQANLAVPLGRWQVHADPKVHLLDEIDRWVDGLRRASAGKGAPNSLGRDVRIIERAMLAVCREGRQEGNRARWADLLAVLGRAEDHLVARPKSTASLHLQPLPRLSPEWITAANDGSPELRLAAALGSQYAIRDDKLGLGPIRVHCLPLEQRKDKYHGDRFAVTAESLARDRRVVWTGSDLVADLAAIAERRLLDCRKAGAQSFELRGRIRARFADIEAFLAGAVDEQRLAGMARAIMAIRWPKDAASMPVLGAGGDAAPGLPSALYGVFRLLYRPARLNEANDVVALDPEPMRLLLAGRVADAARHALRRIRLEHGRPKLYGAVGSREQGQRLAASLCFPIGPKAYERLVTELCRTEGSDESSNE